MKGLLPLFLGIFGTFAFSWLGLTVVPNMQIGSLNPQSDEEGTDIYPQPRSGMALRGARVYAANGCAYCHSQQVRPDYGGSDLERKWGERRSAPRDYIFEPIVLLGKKRTGPDLANVGHRVPLQEEGAATPPPAAATGSPATPSASPATGTASPAAANASSATANASPAAGTASPAASNASPDAANASPAAANASPAAGNASPPIPAASTAAAPSLGGGVQSLAADGKPLPYTAAWHHRHLYNPRSINFDSTMPAFRFLYQKRRISGTASPDALNFAGDAGETPESGWEIVPSYDAQCLVAYLMSRDQSHPLKEAASAATGPAPAASPAKEAKK